MSERKMINVNEEALRQMMAGDRETYLTGETAAVSEPELPSDSGIVPEAVSEQKKEDNPVVDKDSGKGQKRKKGQRADFSELFLKERTVKNKKQIYISVETFEMIRSYLKYIGDVSFIAYVDNILLQHIEEYRDTISELFDKKVNPF